MKSILLVTSLLSAASLAGADIRFGGSGGLVGGHGITSHDHSQCVPAEVFAAANKEADAFLQENPEVLNRYSSGLTPEKLSFYPMAGRLYRDIFIDNFLDLDPTSGILDFNCNGYTYNGHNGSDASLRGFGEQAGGVPIYAALDGTVIGVGDGFPDMNTCGFACTTGANFVVLQHANGRRTWYWHFKKDSILVFGGQAVLAGQQLGMAGSSGFSTGPHLHLELRDNNGATIEEPFAGPCRAGESEWVDQPTVVEEMYLWDFGVTYEDMTPWTGWPHTPPRSGQIAVSDPFVYFWAYVTNQPANSTWRVQFQRPNGTIAFDTGTGGFGGNPHYNRANWWWGYDVPDMHTITGTWHILVDLNGQRMVDAPVEVRIARTPDFNQAPEPISVFVEPAVPAISDVIICNVDTDLVLDDLDYDIVQFHYVWEVDDVVVRDVTTVAHSDAIPRYTATVGSTVKCTVTPSDGIDDGASANAAVTIVATEPDPPTFGDDTCVGGSNDGAPCAFETDCPDGVCGLKSRYLSITPPPSAVAGGEPLTIQFQIFDIDDALAQDDRIGEVWWAGPSQPLLNAPHADVHGAQLICETTPSHAEVWPSGVLHLFGPPIVPGSTYFVRMCDALGDNCSNRLWISTGKWGDVVADFGGSNQPNFGDITAVVDKFKESASAPDITRTDLLSSGGEAVDATANFADISADVDAFKGSLYPYSIPACP